MVSLRATFAPPALHLIAGGRLPVSSTRAGRVSAAVGPANNQKGLVLGVPLPQVVQSGEMNLGISLVGVCAVPKLGCVAVAGLGAVFLLKVTGRHRVVWTRKLGLAKTVVLCDGGKRLAVACYKGLDYQLDTATGRILRHRRNHTGLADFLASCRAVRGVFVATGKMSWRVPPTFSHSTVKIWRAGPAETHLVAREREGQPCGICAQSKPPFVWVIDGRARSGPRSGDVLKVFNYRTSKQVMRLIPQGPSIWGLAYARAGGRLLFCGTSDRAEKPGLLEMLDARSGKLISAAMLRGRGPLDLLAVSPRGGRVATVDRKQGIEVWSTHRNLRLLSQSRPLRPAYHLLILSIAFLRRDRLVTVGNDGEVRWWKVPASRGQRGRP